MVTKEASILFQNTNPRREKGMGKKVNQNRETNDPPNPTDARCIWERKKLLGQASTKQWSGTAGQGLKYPFIAQARQESAMAQGDAGITGLPHLYVSLRTRGQNNNSPLPIFPPKILAGELNEADWYLILFPVRNPHSKNKCFQKNIFVTYFNDQ